MDQPTSFDIRKILEFLPHRYPFLLVDRVNEIVDGEYIKAHKCVSFNEPFFQGHFPGVPVMPGVLILEAMAQVGGVALLSMPENKGKLALFGGIKNARFRRQVTPGDVLEIECTLTKQKGPVGIGEAKATVDGQVAATAELTFALVNAPEASACT